MTQKALLLGIALACGLLATQISPAAVRPQALAAPLSVQVKAGSFAKATATGPQAVTGVGFTPKLLILFGDAGTSDGFASGYQYGFGASDGTTSGAVAGWSWDARGVRGSDTDRRQVAKAITFTTTIAGIEAEADLASFDSDGFTLDWTTNNSEPWVIHYLALGGDAVEAKVSSFDALNDSPGSKSYTHVGFRPDVLLLFGAPSSFGPLEASFGFADAGGNQFAMSVASRNTGSDPTNTARYQRTDRCFVSLEPHSPVIHVVSEASLVSLDATGFTLDWTTAALSPQTLISVAVRGVRAGVGSLTGADSGGDMSYTGAGFQPRGALFAGFNEAASAGIVRSNRFTLGVAGENGDEASIWVSDQDDVVHDTRTDQATYGNRCYIGANSDSSPSGYDTAASLKSWDADGFTLTWEGSPATPAQIGYLLLGDPPAPVGGIAEAPVDSEGPPPGDAPAFAGLALVFALLLTAGVWHSRRARTRGLEATPDKPKEGAPGRDARS